jgi:hypothetical protein
MVVRHTPLLAPVRLNVGGIQIDRHRLTQSGLPRHRNPDEHPLGHPRHPSLHTDPLWIGDPTRQPRSGSRAQSRHRRDHLTRYIRALPVQTDQEVLPGPLRRRQTHQQLTRPEPPPRCLIGPTAASSASTTPSRSHNSLTAAIPDTAVKLGSGAPTHTFGRPPRKLLTR